MEQFAVLVDSTLRLDTPLMFFQVRVERISLLFGQEYARFSIMI
jgi:hypothetical protein